MSDFSEKVERAHLRKEIEEELRQEVEERQRLSDQALRDHDARMRGLFTAGVLAVGFLIPAFGALVGLAFRLFRYTNTGVW